jgi:FkbM family methyltransferase
MALRRIPMPILEKILNAAANRVPLDARGERALVENALRRLPGVVYRRLREQGLSPGGIVDIGAYEGHWTRSIREIFPEPPVLMVEARKELEPVLRQVCSELPRVDYSISLLGRKSAELIPFHVRVTGSSIFAERSDAPGTMQNLAMRTLDEIMSTTQAAAPLFLKLDVQGAELECLGGGADTLRKTEVVQLEVALLNYTEGAPQAAEVIAFMDKEGFAMIDIAGFVRPDGAHLVQIDIIFAKKTSHLRPQFFHF